MRTNNGVFDVCLFVHIFISIEKKTKQDAIECFIALIIYSTCFGHLYAYHQELDTILVLLPLMVCDALVAGGRMLGAEQQAMRPGRGKSHNFPPGDGRISTRNMLSRL